MKSPTIIILLLSTKAWKVMISCTKCQCKYTHFDASNGFSSLRKLLFWFIVIFTSQYDPSDEKSRNAALNYNFKRGNGRCAGLTTSESPIRVIHSMQDNKAAFNVDSNELICDGIRKRLIPDQLNDSLANCAYDATPPTAVYVRNTMIDTECDAIKHAFSAISNRFGTNGSLIDVFQLFGEFEPGQRNILFSDNAKSLITDDSDNQTESFFNYEDHETMYRNIQCKN